MAEGSVENRVEDSAVSGCVFDCVVTVLGEVKFEPDRYA